MTMPLMPGVWTMDAVAALPENGCRYELSNGSLLVTPPPTLAHVITQSRLSKLLTVQAPSGFLVLDGGVGVSVGPSYYIPDLVVLRDDVVAGPSGLLAVRDVLVAVEILSPSSGGNDLGLKRHEYARAGIPDYWVIDRDQRTILVLTLPDGGHDYEVAAKVAAGETYGTERPFPIAIDPASVC